MASEKFQTELAEELKARAYSRRPLVLYGSGQLSRSLIWSLSDLLIAYHLNVRVGLTAYHTGMLLFGSALLGAVLDIIVATLVSRLHDPLRSSLRLQAISGCMAVSAALALFGPTPNNEVESLIYLYGASLVFRAAYAVMDVTQNALTSLLPRNADQASAFVSTRTIVSSIGRLAAASLVFLAMERSSDALADLKAVILIAVPVVISVLALASVETKALPETHQPADWKGLPYRRLAAPLIAVVSEVAFLGLAGPIMALVPNSASGQSLLFAMVCGTVIGPLLGRARGHTSIATPVFPIVATLCAIGLLLPTSAWWAVALAFAFGVASSAVTNLIWQRVAWIVRDVASATGKRIDVTAFALLTASIKVGIAISGGLLGFQLDGVRAGSAFGIGSTAALFGAGGLLTALALSAEMLPRRGSVPAVPVPAS